jgi:hypothetical protein
MNKLQEEPKQVLEQIDQNNPITRGSTALVSKQETLEEVAERLVKETTFYGSQEASIGSSARSYFETELRCVLLGMQWQQEQIGKSQFLQKLRATKSDAEARRLIFEQFKKK